MEKIIAIFDGYFSHWDIHLPPSDVAARRRGKIVSGGWAIWYLFGSDKHGEYMDYYASHRMTSDCHTRVYSDGRVKSLPAISEMRLCSQDPKEDKMLEKKFQASNRRVETRLKKKGFGVSGDEPFAVRLNRVLNTRLDEQPREVTKKAKQDK